MSVADETWRISTGDA